MVYRVNPEDIRNEGYRRVYVRLLELHLDEDMSRAASDSTDGKFLAANFIEYFNRRREFSERQIRYVDFVYDKVKRYKDTNLVYKTDGSLEELVGLVRAVAVVMDVSDRSSRGHKGNLIQQVNALTKGRMLHGSLFNSLNFCIEQLPAEKGREYREGYERLYKKYWEIYNSLRDKDRSLRDEGGENGKSS